MPQQAKRSGGRGQSGRNHASRTQDNLLRAWQRSRRRSLRSAYSSKSSRSNFDSGVPFKSFLCCSSKTNISLTIWLIRGSAAQPSIPHALHSHIFHCPHASVPRSLPCLGAVTGWFRVLFMHSVSLEISQFRIVNSDGCGVGGSY
jgi:hypothetical protein